MTNFIRFLATSKRLYPLWRNGYIERAFFLLCRAWLPQPKRTAFNRTVFGFDFSKWQGVINFAKVFAYGTRFLILRAVYGIKQDERFAEYMPIAVAILPVSVYALYDPVFPPKSQADKVISVIAPYKDDIRRVWLDLEFWWDGAYKDPGHWKIYRDTIKAAGYQVGWYTRKTWWDSRVGAYAAEFGKDPLFAAQYSSALTLIPNGWNMAMLWQSGTPAIGSQVGTGSAEVDLDIWNDNFIFELEWDGATPPPGGTMEYVKGTTTAADSAGGLRVRKTASSTAEIVGYLKFGTPVEGWLQNGWIEIQFNGQKAYISAAWVTYTIVPPPVPTITDVNIVLAKGSTVTRKYSDGTEKVETA